jgi:hypothetical protein
VARRPWPGENEGEDERERTPTKHVLAWWCAFGDQNAVHDQQSSRVPVLYMDARSQYLSSKERNCEYLIAHNRHVYISPLHKQRWKQSRVIDDQRTGRLPEHIDGSAQWGAKPLSRGTGF